MCQAKPHSVELRWLLLSLCALFATIAPCSELKASQGRAGSERITTWRVETDPACARVSALSWDTEGGDRFQQNLLRPSGALLGMCTGGYLTTPMGVLAIALSPDGYSLALG